MNVLRMAKLFGWESKMNDRIAEKREAELEYVWKQQILNLISVLLKWASSLIVLQLLAHVSCSFAIPMIIMVSTYATL